MGEEIMIDDLNAFYSYNGMFLLAEEYELEFWQTLNSYSRQLSSSKIGHDIKPNEFCDLFAMYLNVAV